MVATHHRKGSFCIRKNTLFYLLYIGSVDADRHIVFAFAGCGARMTTYAFSVIYNETKLHFIGIA
jgi:hypothetical protein